jgi:hypothetical protein
LHTLTDHTSLIVSVAFSPDGSKLATGSCDRTARIWDTGSGTLLHTLIAHICAIVSVAFSPDGSKLATGSEDRTARIWDTGSGTLLHTLIAHICAIVSVAFSPDGSKLATGSGDNKARIWYDTRAENHNAKQKAALALACALHPRLGESSPVQLLDPYVLQDIVELARPDSFGPIEQEQPAQHEHQGLTRYLPAVAIAAPSIAAAAWMLHHFMHR